MIEMNDNEETEGAGTPKDSRLADTPCSAFILNVTDPTYEWQVEGLPFNSGKQRKSGVYAFFAYEGPNEVCLYVGKAYCLRNRLQQHVDHSEWMNRFFDELDDALYRDDPLPLLLPLFAKVWFTCERAGMESKLIDALQPRYNQRYEG